MRNPRLLLSLAALALLHPAAHASVRTQAETRQHILTSRQTPSPFHPCSPIRRQILFAPAAHFLPESVNPPTRTTVFSYLVNLIRGLFARSS